MEKLFLSIGGIMIVLGIPLCPSGFPSFFGWFAFSLKKV
jgi:hypothetical protein